MVNMNCKLWCDFVAIAGRVPHEFADVKLALHIGPIQQPTHTPRTHTLTPKKVYISRPHAYTCMCVRSVYIYIYTYAHACMCQAFLGACACI